MSVTVMSITATLVTGPSSAGEIDNGMPPVRQGNSSAVGPSALQTLTGPHQGRPVNLFSSVSECGRNSARGGFAVGV